MPRGYKKGAKRNEPVLESFLRRLRLDLAGFKQEPEEIQVSLATLIFNYGNKHRAHKGTAGAMSITHQEITHRFGRGRFDAINGRLGVFDVSRNWSISRNLTKAYTLKPAVAEIVDAYLHQGRRRLTSLVSESGLRMRTLPKAVASKDMDGITAKAWDKAEALNKVPVDVAMLDALKAELDAMRGPQRNLFGNLDAEAVDYTRNMVAKIRRMARVDVSGDGFVMLRYVEATSGRLYAQGVNLQTVPTLIKQAALHGLYEYDIENCHYSIFQQMAARFGFQCKAIADYLANKSGTRKTIADDVGITVDQAKVCLLAIMYGARQSEWHKSAIPDAIGVPNAKKLYQHPLFAGIAADIDKGREAIIAGWPRREKTLLNDAKKSIATKKKPKQILAHLIQGVEARMLRAALDLYSKEIVLLQHDGFASTTELDMVALREAMEKSSGYRLELSVDRIAVDADFGASRH